ncbi:UDP-glucuronosyltransferase [Aphelenchoides besseyi]|nr:UDP-glucuronosyltransferase [Aphelenchoides besseyi]
MNQPSILAHPHTVAFISHMGLNSLNEAARFGVPVVSIPFLADQPFNTAVIVKRKLGVFVDRRHITIQPFIENLATTTNNKLNKNSITTFDNNQLLWLSFVKITILNIPCQKIGGKNDTKLYQTFTNQIHRAF